MFFFKIIRKIGKMLRGGAGKREIFLGALCGVLIGFIPGFNVLTALLILIALLLNGNIGFTMLGMGVGKLLSMALAPITFEIGYFMIHRMGMEGLFATLANSPVTAFMGFESYAQIGGAPFAVIIGILFGKYLSSLITKVREQMVKAGKHDKVSKVTENKFYRFLMWMVFGKQKISTEDVLAKESPLLRKSGLILVGSVLVIGLLLELLLLDFMVKRSLTKALAEQVGAEVNVDKADLSLTRGKLELKKVQITDPDKLENNMLQLETLEADLSIKDLMRGVYTVDLLAGSVVERDVPRVTPGKRVTSKAAEKRRKEKERKTAEENAAGQTELDKYLSKAQKWKGYQEKLSEYLETYKKHTENLDKKPEIVHQTAKQIAKKAGALKAKAQLVTDSPTWLIHEIRLDQVKLDSSIPLQRISAKEVTSHPALNQKPTTFVMTPEGSEEPTATLTFRFDNPDAPHEAKIQLKDIPAEGWVGSDDFPLNLEEGKANILAEGSFSTDEITLPFNLIISNMKADVADGESVLGMDTKTANKVFSSLEQLNIEGAVNGTLTSPRLKIDTEKLTAELKEALIAAGKKELADRANKELDKAKEKANEEINKATEKAKEELGEEAGKLLESEEAKEATDKLKSLMPKKLF